MDDDFYHFTIEHSKLTNGLRHADSAALIALKSRAYLNLLQDKANGKHVNSKDIKKHRSDVLKNVVIIEDSQITAPEPIVTCIRDSSLYSCVEAVILGQFNFFRQKLAFRHQMLYLCTIETTIQVQITTM